MFVLNVMSRPFGFFLISVGCHGVADGTKAAQVIERKIIEELRARVENYGFRKCSKFQQKKKMCSYYQGGLNALL